MTDSFRTVAGAGRARFEVRGSRFLCRIRPVRTVAEAEQVIDRARSEHADATHTVPAYRVRADPLREWASDDGEPPGSAGKPALTVLEREGVENVVAVVARHFGGTELGVGGLARAYARAVKDALDAAGTVEAVPREQFSITVAYDDSGSVRRILESTDCAFDADYGAEVTFDVRAPEATAPRVRDRVRSATSGRALLRGEFDQ